MIERPIRVAANMLAWAAEQGFLGVAAYVALWVILPPVMLTICIVGAIIGAVLERQGHDQAADAGDPNASRTEAERQQWEEWDRRYEAAQARLNNSQTIITRE